MKTWYTYWDNSARWHGGILLLVQADSLSDADNKFQATLGYDPSKKSTVGVTITEHPNVGSL